MGSICYQRGYPVTTCDESLKKMGCYLLTDTEELMTIHTGPVVRDLRLRVLFIGDNIATVLLAWRGGRKQRGEK